MPETVAPAGSWVVIGREDVEGTATVAPRSVKHWESRGWYVVGAAEAPSNAAPALPADPPALDDGPFNSGFDR